MSINDLPFVFVNVDMAGPGRRRRTRKWTGAYKIRVRSQLQRVGFSQHEIRLWIDEKVLIEGRPGQNLIFARRRIMRAFQEEGHSFKTAVGLAEQDRIESATDEGWSRDLAENYLFGTLRVLSPNERKVTGPIVRYKAH